MRRVLVAVLLALAALPATAGAEPDLEIGIADDRLLLGDFDAAARAVQDWKAAGVDVVRIHARWEDIAPARGDRLPPRGFRPHEHTDPQYRFKRLDDAFGLVRPAGMKVLLAITGPGPLWSSESPGRGNPRYRPSPKHFAAFAAAVATRYGSEVDRYLLWNEPNVPLWLQPQKSCSRRGCTPFAPHQYRRLVQAATPVVKAADPGAEVIVGTLAPLGSSRRQINAAVAPLAFIRAMACVDTRLRSIRSGSCRGFRPIAVDAFSMHPHGVRLAPERHDPVADQVRLADLGRVNRLLDRLHSRGRITGPSPTPLYLSEYGYQTNPPDPFVGVSPTTQASWLARAAEKARNAPRVRALVQYVWRDEPVTGRGGSRNYSGWQSGLFFDDGREKPALVAFRFPLTVRGSTVWGQARPGGAHRVTILADGAPVGEASTDEWGTFVQTVTFPDGAKLVSARTEDGLESMVVKRR